MPTSTLKMAPGLGVAWGDGEHSWRLWDILEGHNSWPGVLLYLYPKLWNNQNVMMMMERHVFCLQTVCAVLLCPSSPPPPNPTTATCSNGNLQRDVRRSKCSTRLCKCCFLNVSRCASFCVTLFLFMGYCSLPLLFNRNKMYFRSK